MAHSQPWILHLVAGPALDPGLIPPKAAASAMSSPDSTSFPSGRPLTSLAPTLCPCPAAPRAAVSPVPVFPSAAPLQPVASRAGGSTCPIYPPGLGFDSRSTPPSRVQPASPAAPRAAVPRAPVSPAAFASRARAPSGSSAADDTPHCGGFCGSFLRFDLVRSLSRCRSSSGAFIGRTRHRPLPPRPARTARPLQSRH